MRGRLRRLILIVTHDIVSPKIPVFILIVFVYSIRHVLAGVRGSIDMRGSWSPRGLRPPSGRSTSMMRAPKRIGRPALHGHGRVVAKAILLGSLRLCINASHGWGSAIEGEISTTSVAQSATGRSRVSGLANRERDVSKRESWRGQVRGSCCRRANGCTNLKMGLAEDRTGFADHRQRATARQACCKSVQRPSREVVTVRIGASRKGGTVVAVKR